MAFLETILFPLIYVLGLVLDVFASRTGNYGSAVMLLSGFVALVSYPLSKYARKIELRDKTLHLAMDPKVRYAKQHFKGETQFNEIEKIYREYDYHPIHSIKSAFGFMLQLPLLLSCLLLLWDHPSLQGQPFLVLPDLGTPDGLITIAGLTINVLPLLMASITLTETWCKPEITGSGRIKFTFVTLVILALIYDLPSAVVLYWLTTNTISLVSTLVRRHRGATSAVESALR